MCNLEFPDLEPLYQDHRDDGFVPLGIAARGGFDETEETLDAFVEQTGVTFAIVWDDGTRQQFAWPPAISPYPRHALVGRDGVIRYLAAEVQADDLEAAVVAALAE